MYTDDQGNEIIEHDDVISGLQTTLEKAVHTELNYNILSDIRYAHEIPVFPQALQKTDEGNYHLVYDSCGEDSSELSKKRVLDFLITPITGEKYSDTSFPRLVSDVNSILQDLHESGQGHAAILGRRLDDGSTAVYIRAFKTGDFPCSEHPELLLAQPLGQHHCRICREMQMAGCFHLPREFNDEGEPVNAEQD